MPIGESQTPAPLGVRCDRCTRISLEAFRFGGVCAGLYDVRPEEGNPWSFLGRPGESTLCSDCAEDSAEYRNWEANARPWLGA